MRKQVSLSVFALSALILGNPLRADDRSIVVLFGPTTAEHAQLAAQTATVAARNWLAIPGSAMEIRRPGVADSQQLARFMPAKDIEAALLDAARASSQIDLRTFLDALDKAAYTSAHHSGIRVLIVIVDSPPPTAEAENRIQQTMEFCRSNAIHVLVVDGSKPGGQGLKALAAGTGGMSMDDPKTLDANLLMVAPVAKPGSEADASKPAAAAVTNPLHARFIRTRVQWNGEGIASDVGPAHGMTIVELPFRALQFNETGSSYLARARVTAMVKNAEGKVVWQAKKEITLKGPSKRLEERRAGNLYLMRDIQLPGGKYTVDALAEDLLANKSWTCSEPLKATVNLPGFSVSDALFVRAANDSKDKFESDVPLNYEGTELSPLLDPAFRSDQTFDLQLYFILYPDLRGGQAQMSMEILHNGQAVGRTELAFNDKIRDTSRESQDVGAGVYGRTGEQKSQFPYLATIRDATFSEGQYEARVTIRQDRNTVTRSLPFRITAAAPAK
jgi:hypothetical protein